MTDELKLKPCPFCGGKAKITCVRRGNYRREGDNYQGLCNKCKARGPLVQDSSEKAAAAWNNHFGCDCVQNARRVDALIERGFGQ